MTNQMQRSLLITTSSFGKAGRGSLDVLDQAGVAYDLNPHGRKLTASEAIELLAHRPYDGMIAGVEPLSHDVLKSAPTLKVVSRCGTGLDNVDLNAAAALGIAVTNTPDAHVDAVAELTVAGMLSLTRQIARTDRAIRRGEWPRQMGCLLRGKTVGLVGFGRVARAVAALLAPFNTRLVASDPVADQEAARALHVTMMDLDDLLTEARIVSLHLPYSPENHHLLNERRLSLLADDAMIINTSRGGLIDEPALHRALTAGRVGAAFLDTFEEEPYTGSLIGLQQVVLTSHIGGYAREARIDMEQQAARNAIAHLG